MIIHWNTRNNPQIFIGIGNIGTHITSPTITIDGAVKINSMLAAQHVRRSMYRGRGR